MIRILRAVFIALLLLAMIVTVVYAAISAPDTLQLNQVEVYRDCLEEDDQGYLITFTCDYASSPSEGNIDTLFVVRLLNNAGIELDSIAPTAYPTDGYDYGACWIYFAAADAPVWNPSPTYSMEISGNPILEWGGDPPTATNSPFSLWYDGGGTSATETRLTTRIRALAQIIEYDWGGTTDLIEPIAGEMKLTATGEEYFTTIIPNLRTICPALFAAGISVVAPAPEREHDQSYAANLTATLTGTTLDFTRLGINLGLSSMWVGTILWFAISIGLAWAAAYYSNSFKPAMLVIFFMMPLGALTGFIPLIITIVAAFACGVGIIYVFFYRQTA